MEDCNGEDQGDLPLGSEFLGLSTPARKPFHINMKDLGMHEPHICHLRGIPKVLRHLVDLGGGGMLTGLTEFLNQGISVQRYSYVDTNHAARRIAQHKLHALHGAVPSLAASRRHREVAQPAS